MYFARLLYPVHVLGPGARAALWVSGCDKNCFNCANPELRQQKEDSNIPVKNIIALISSLPNEKKGFTITGGEPFDQAEELSELISFLNTLTDDILIYSGYTYQELLQRNDTYINYILENIAVLIDGRYEEKLNFGNKLKGSENQKVYFFREKYREAYSSLDVCTASERQAESFICENGSVVTAGFQKQDFRNEFNASLRSHLNRKV